MCSNEREATQSSSDGGFDETDGNKDRYEMSKNPHGVALLIHNAHFQDGAVDRAEMEEDEERMAEQLRALKYQVVELRELTGEEITAVCSVIAGVCRAEDLPAKTREQLVLKGLRNVNVRIESTDDSFLCCLVSHGALGKIYGTDGVAVDVRRVAEYFGAKKCPCLRGKPKVFLIQASLQTAIGKTEGHMEPADVSALVEESDFLLSYSVYPGTPSYRAHDALYLSNLRRALKAKHTDLQSMLAEAHRRVQEKVELLQQKGAVEYIQQCPLRVDTLRYKVYF